MASLVTTLVVGWFVERNGPAFEAWLKRRLRNEPDPRLRSVFRWGLQVVQRARRDPYGFADEVEAEYSKALAIYREYQRSEGSGSTSS